MMGMMHERGCSTSTASSARDRLPADLFHQLERIFDAEKLDYIARVLTAGELRVVGDLYDAFIIAQIKEMSDDELNKFDEFVPNDDQQQKFYNTVQREWITREEWLLGTVLRRCPTQKELFSHFMNNHNGQRYRAYFTMKYPERMRRVEIGTCP